MGFHIRAIESNEIHAAANLVARVFEESVAPLYGSVGIREFMSYASTEAFVQRLSANHLAFVAVDESGRVAGIVELRDHRHVSLLFVEPASQRKGLGRGLVTAAIDACQEANPYLERLTVNASPNSVGAYERFGFGVMEPEREANGIRFVPMALTVG